MKFYLTVAASVLGLVVYVVWLAVVQGASVFSDPDVFYHMGMATHLWEFGFADQFSGLAPTTLGQHFVDQHFLLHALLWPLITLMTPVVGTKVLVILLFISCVAAFAWMLRTLRFSGWWVGVIVLVLTNPWLFRLNLVKATPLALTLLWLSIIVLAKKKYWWLAVIGAIYVWTHGGFVLLPVIVLVWCAVGTCYSKYPLQALTPLLYTVGGITLALLTHPAFPENIFFYWEQLVQIGVVNYQDNIGVGGEWYPYDPGSLLFGHGLLIALFLVGCVGCIALRKRCTPIQLFFIVTMVGMTVLTLKSRRYVEYFSPFLAATVASLYFFSVQRWLHQHLSVQLTQLLPAAVVIMAAMPVMLSGLSGLRHDLSDGQSVYYLRGVGEYLANQPVGIVAPSDWDDFPALWYHAPYQKFIIGLDATFLYRADAYRYTAWKNLTLGEAADPTQAVTTVAADYYVVTKDHQAMYQQLSDVGSQIVYQDDEAWVLIIK